MARSRSGSYPCGSTPIAPQASGLDSAEVAILTTRGAPPAAWAKTPVAVASRTTALPATTANPRREIEFVADIFKTPFSVEGEFGLQELSKAWVSGGVKNLGRATVSCNDALIHEDDPVRDIFRELHLVCNEQ